MAHLSAILISDKNQCSAQTELQVAAYLAGRSPRVVINKNYIIMRSVKEQGTGEPKPDSRQSFQYSERVQ